MTGLIENPTWEPEIYQLEETDPVMGGIPNALTGEGIDNVPAQQLANRTLWLKALVDAHEAILSGGLNFATQADIDAAFNAIVNASPATLDTLNELATALGNDPNFATTMTALIGTKLDKAGGDISGPLKILGGSLYIRSPANGNAHVWLQDETGKHRALFYWSRTADKISIRRYAADGIAVEGQLDMFTDRIEYNGQRLFTASDFALKSIPTAWVNFDGTGVVLIREAQNISSVTDLAVGKYQANFTTPMATTNYATLFHSTQAGAVTDERDFVRIESKTTTSVIFTATNINGIPIDHDHISLLVMGGL